jgi:carbonic anhydrase
MKMIQRIRLSCAWRLSGPALSLVVACSLTCSAAEFGYHDPIGPADWCGLSTDYDACCGGEFAEQSPIDIHTGNVEFQRPLPVLKFKLPGVTSLNVVNNGHTVQANVPPGATLELAGTVYNLLQFHFHTPSEHTVDGAHAPIEMHMVHKTADGLMTAVVGVFIVPGKEHKELQKIWANLPVEENEETDVARFHLHNILPGKMQSFRYPGSLTTPPCTEGVSWNILATPITMSPDQIVAFQAIFSGDEFPNGNARPTQDLNGRVVVTDAK